MRDKKIHEDVLAITGLIHHLMQSRGEDLSVEAVVVFVVESRPCQDHGEVVGPLASVNPFVFPIVPIMRSTRKSHQTIRKLRPDLKGEIHLLRCDGRVVVEAQDGLRGF